MLTVQHHTLTTSSMTKRARDADMSTTEQPLYSAKAGEGSTAAAEAFLKIPQVSLPVEQQRVLL